MMKMYNKRDFRLTKPEKRSLLGVNEHLRASIRLRLSESRGETCFHYAKRSNQKELNAEIALLDGFAVYYSRNIV